MADKDRRSFPRIPDEALALKLNAGDFDTMTHTLNISASGIYCKIDKEIPIMSRVRLALMLPGKGEGEGPRKELNVEGVVVRQHPVIIEGETRHYDVAIFFENLSQKDREAIAAYVARTKKE